MNNYYVYQTDGEGTTKKLSIWEYTPGVNDIALKGYGGSAASGTGSTEASSTVVVGDHKEVVVPTSLGQTGIIADYTNYDQIDWAYDCKKVFDSWKSLGRKSSYHIATVKGYYLVAVSPSCGTTGDLIVIVLEGDVKINAIVADVKGSDKGNMWGHVYDNKVSLIEWEIVNRPSHEEINQSLRQAGWYGKKVVKIENYGDYTKKVK